MFNQQPVDQPNNKYSYHFDQTVLLNIQNKNINLIEMKTKIDMKENTTNKEFRKKKREKVQQRKRKKK